MRYIPINPHSPEILLGELHDSVEPLPECEAPVWQGLLAELGPGYHQVGAVCIVAHISKTETKQID